MPKGVRYTNEQIQTMLADTDGLSLKDAATKLKVSVGAICNWRGKGKVATKKKAAKTIKMKIEPKTRAKKDSSNIIQLIKQVKTNINLIEKGLKKCKL